MSTPMFVNPESSTHADGAQSSRVPVPLPEDPYEAIRQAYLVGMDTESKTFEGEARTPESPHIVAPTTCHVKESEGSGTSGARSTSLDSTTPLSPDHLFTHTTPVLVPILRRTARMAVRVLPVMSPGLSVGMVEVAAMSDSTFRKRFRSSYDSSSSPTLPVGTGIEGPGVDDESYGLDGESHDVDDESHGLDDESYGIERAMSETLGLGYGALSCRELALDESHVYTSPMASLTTTISVDDDQFIESEGRGIESDGLGLEEEEAVPKASHMASLTTTISVDDDRFIERPVLALEAWAGRVDTRMTDMSRAGYDDHRLVYDMCKEKIRA
nr:hypothetical protein [Tanacetum cinerariifolium]